MPLSIDCRGRPKVLLQSGNLYTGSVGEMNVPLISFTNRESHALPYHSQHIWLLTLTFLFIVSVHEIEIHLQDERSLEFSVMCFLPMMSRSIMRPVLSPHKVLINHIDYLLTTESYILMGSLVVWSFIWFGRFFRKKANNRKQFWFRPSASPQRDTKKTFWEFWATVALFHFHRPINGTIIHTHQTL